MRDESPPTRELEPVALAMAREIRERVGPELFEGFADDAGWQRWEGKDPVWSRVDERPIIKAEAVIDLPPLVVASVVKEVDLGPRARDLVQWRVGRISPFLDVVHYVTRLPVPLSPRDYCVTERYGVEEQGEVLVLGQDLDPAEVPAMKASVRAVAQWKERGCVRGSLKRSAWHVIPERRDGRIVGTRVRRLVERDLCTWLPARLCARVSVEGVARDLEKVRELSAAWEGGPIHARTEADWFYKVLRAHLA